MSIEGVDLKWLGHSSFKIGKDIYIDPFQISDSDKAAVILITHSHYDHCSIKDLEKIVNKDTVIITVPDSQSKISSLKIKGIKLVKPGEKFKIKDIEIETFPAYNVDKEKLNFHPKENQWVGFIIKINGKRIYHAGDTDLIPEMNTLEDIDIALLPIGGKFTMDYEEAANAANIIKPRIVIPMHYGSINLPDNSEEFKEKVDPEIKVMIL